MCYSVCGGEKGTAVCVKVYQWLSNSESVENDGMRNGALSCD